VFKHYEHITNLENEPVRAFFLSGGHKNVRVTPNSLQKAHQDKIWDTMIDSKEESLDCYTLSLYAVALDPHGADEGARVKRLSSKAIHWAYSCWRMYDLPSNPFDVVV
jgi:hypothetical protein